MLEKSIEDVVKSDVGILAVFRTKAGKVCALGKNGLGVLNLVNKDEARGVISR